MRSILIIFFFFSSLSFCLASEKTKTSPIDSMLLEIGKIRQPELKVDKVLEFLDKPENQYLKNADVLVNKALSIANQYNYASGKINALVKLAYIYFRKSDYKKALEYAFSSNDLAAEQHLDKELAKSSTLLGIIYDELGAYDKSSQFYFSSLKIYEKLKDKEGISASLGDIGKDFYNQQEYKKALDYFNKSLAIAIELKKDILIKKQYNNIAVVYGNLKKYDSATFFLNKALMINTRLGDKLGQGINIMNIGYDQMNSGDTQKALINFHLALDLFKLMDNRLHVAECQINVGSCLYNSGKIDESIPYFEEALSEGRKSSYYKIIYSAAEMLNKIYSDKKDTIRAYKYLLWGKEAGDTLYSERKQKVLSKLELQYLDEKKEFNRRLDQQARNNIILTVIIGLIAGLVILGLILSRDRIKSKFLKLEKEKLDSELAIKNRELTVNLLALIKKNEMLSGLSGKLIQLEHNTRNTEVLDVIHQIGHELRESTDDKMINEFTMRFQEVHAGYYEKLLASFPDLTQNELKICAFLRLNMSTKDISELTGQQLATIDQARYRLRKKLRISNSETNLVTFLSQF